MMHFTLLIKNMSKLLFLISSTEIKWDSKLLFNIGKIVINISHEFYYRLNKLKYNKEDGLTRYVLKNRRLIATLGMSSILACGVAACKEIKNLPVEDTVTEESSSEYDTSYVMYEIKSGDTLSQIAADYNVSLNDILEFNNINPDLIYAGTKIKIPYQEINDTTVERIDTENRTIEEIAKIYETDVSTIYELNKEAIIFVNDEYVFLSRSILVPNVEARRVYFSNK